jgi:hypothetical protein
MASKDISPGPRQCRDDAPKPTLARANDIGADLAKTNVNGGGMAIGHPLGASGARILTTLVNAIVIERLS